MKILKMQLGQFIRLLIKICIKTVLKLIGVYKEYTTNTHYFEVIVAFAAHSEPEYQRVRKNGLQ